MPQPGGPQGATAGENGPPESSGVARNAGLDLLRAAAALIVVYAHAYCLLLEQRPEVVGSLLRLSVNVACNAVVPVFLLISGYFQGLRFERVGFRQSLKPALWKSGRIYGLYLAWALLFLAAQGHFDPKRFYWRALSIPVTELIAGPGPSAHLWFLPVLAVGQIALVAFPRRWRRVHLLTTAATLYAIILVLCPYGHLIPWRFTMAVRRYLTGLSFLFAGAALGAFLKRSDFRRFGLALAASGFALVSLELVWLLGRYDRDFLGVPLLGTPLVTVGAFLWLRAAGPQGLGASAASGLARCGLGIYTMHPLAINALWPALALLPRDWVQARLHLLVASAFVASAAVTRLVSATRFSWLVT